MVDEQTKSRCPKALTTVHNLQEIQMNKATTLVTSTTASASTESSAIAEVSDQKLTSEQFAGSIVQQLDVLAERRKDWEANDYKKANEGLYSLLADCLGIFNARFVKGSKDDQKTLRFSLIERLQADGVRVVKTTTTLTMLARYVFNSDRKRAQGYGYVLAAAVSHNIKANEFPAWVVAKKGIEEIKRLMVKNPESIAKQQAVVEASANVKTEIELNTLLPLASVNISGLTGQYAVLLARPNPTGGADIVGTLSDIKDSLVNTLIQQMAKRQVASEIADKELGRQISKESNDLLAGSEQIQQDLVAA